VRVQTILERMRRIKDDERNTLGYEKMRPPQQVTMSSTTIFSEAQEARIRVT